MNEVIRTKQVIVVRTDLNMRKGKMAAQVAHASLGAFLSQSHGWNTFKRDDGLHYGLLMDVPEIVKQWLDNSFTKICVGVNSEKELLDLYDKVKDTSVLHKLITDNGTTEFHGVPTITCLAIGPDTIDNVDQFTKDLRLL